MNDQRSRAQDAFTPPTKDGVGVSCVALPLGDWPTVIDFLAQRFPGVARDVWLARMLRGEVLNAQGAVVLPQHPYQPQSRIYYYREVPAEPVIPFEESVLYQDDYLVVADKPHFLPVTPSGRYLQQSLLVRLKRKLGIDTLAPMHRIDRETAGLVLLTIQPHTRNAYQSLFRDRAVSKSYEAIAPWRADLDFPLRYRSRLVESEAFMKMCAVEGEPNAETMIDLLEKKAGLARYALQPVSGQKHQLRAHMDALGIAILNDRIYPQLQPDQAGDIEIDYSKPLQLLAKSIAFIDPISGQQRCFESRRNLEF